MIGETQKEELKEEMRGILLSRGLLFLSVASMVYGFFAIIFQIHYFLNSPDYAEGMLFAGIGLGAFLGRHEVAIDFIREDLKTIKEILTKLTLPSSP